MDLATLKDVMSLRMGTSVASQIRKRVPDARVSQMLDHFVQYVGSSPYASPAVLCSIAHMQTELGVWYPMGGTRAVPQALEQLAGELGVELRPGTGIARILSQDGRAAGVVTDSGETVRLSAVVSNMDSVRTMRELVGGRPAASSPAAGSATRPAPASCSTSGSIAATITWRTTTSSSPRTRRRSSTGSTARASPRRTPPATSPRPPARSPAWRRRAAKRCTSWCTPRSCARTMTGPRCSQPIAR